MIEGLSHITFIVQDLDKTTVFLNTVFDAKEIYASGEKTFSIGREKFFLIGAIWIVMMEGDAELTQSYNHIAFKIPEDEFGNYQKRVESLGLTVKPPRPRVKGEGRSLYFYDYDNHLFELHTGTLDERMKRYQHLSDP